MIEPHKVEQLSAAEMLQYTTPPVLFYIEIDIDGDRYKTPAVWEKQQAIDQTVAWASNLQQPAVSEIDDGSILVVPPMSMRSVLFSVREQGT